MFYQDYLVQRALKEKLSLKLQQNRAKQNATVTVRDLVISQDKSTSFGESSAFFNLYTEFEMLPRLIDHIKSLSQIANLHHQKDYCEEGAEGKFQLKSANANTITRLSLNEFALYGNKPLTVAEFSLLVEAIRELARNNHDNVHLLLSSFSVINAQGMLLNITLYVQCGEQTKIDVISKGINSAIDITYPHAKNFSQQVPQGGPTKNVSNYIAGDADQAMISNNSILEIEIKGGAKFIQAVDVCLDHNNQHAKRLFIKGINNEYSNDQQIIPEQVDHILTSNSIKVKEHSKLSPTILHIDPLGAWNFDRENSDRPIDLTSTLNLEDINAIKRYPDMHISSIPGEISVTNPPFGSDYRLKIYQERTLGGFIPSIDAKVKSINQKIIAHQIQKTTINNRSHQFSSKLQKIEDNADTIQLRAKILLNKLEKICQPTFFEFIFRTENYYLKQKAKKIINDSAITINDDKVEILSAITPWVKDLQFKINLLTDFPNSFVSHLKTMINPWQIQITPIMEKYISRSRL